MRILSAYEEAGSLTLNGEQAVQELYARLARWCDEIAYRQRAGDLAERDRLVHRSMTLLDLIDSLIDVSACPEVASRILALHRFAVKTLVKLKVRNDEAVLQGLAPLFLSMGDIFSVMGAARGSAVGAMRIPISNGAFAAQKCA